jgi:hypothetical protein
MVQLAKLIRCEDGSYIPADVETMKEVHGTYGCGNCNHEWKEQ